MKPTRLISVRQQLLLGFGLILGLALMLAVIGYLSLRNVQQVAVVNLQQANDLHDHAARVENRFLLARQNEVAFLEQWRDLGLEIALDQYAAVNQKLINSAREELALVNSLAENYPELVDEVAVELDTLEPLLSYYAQTFANTVNLVVEQGQAEGLERSLAETFTIVEQGVIDSPDPRFYRILLRIQANEQSYFNTGREEYVDRTRLLTNDLIQLLSNESDQLQTATPTFQLVSRLQAHQSIFLQLVSLERSLAANRIVFGEITEDVNRAIATINDAAEEGVLAAQRELMVANQQSSAALLAMTIITLGVSLATARALSQRIVPPLAQLNETAQAIGAGTAVTEVTVGGSLEMAALGNAFNEMNRRLNELIGSLEQRVADRTRDLALAGEVSRRLTAIRDVDELLNEAVQIIQQQFDLYQAQVYLLDKSGRNLILRAGTGRATAALLAQGHRLPVGPGSINGVAAADRQPVLVSDTADNAIFRPNPLLPDTRSELAAPLIAAQELIGVLDLQSATPGAFTEENLTAFELLAGQLATSIENAYLFDEINRAQEAIAAQARLLTREGWRDFLDAVEQPEYMGYSYNQSVVRNLPAPSEQIATANAPILIAGEPVGRLEVEGLDQVDDDLLTAVANQVSRQIENLRLLNQAERYRAAAEDAQARLRREGWDAYRETTKLPGGYLYNLSEVQPLSAQNGHAQPQNAHPIAIQGELIGEIGILDDQPADEETEQLLTAVAERLGAHLESLRLTSQTEEALAETAFLYQASAHLNRAVNYRDILNVIQQYTVAGGNAHSIGLALFDADWTEESRPASFRYLAAWSVDPNLRLAGHYWLKDFPTADRILQQQEPTIINNIWEDDRFDENLRQIYGHRLQGKTVMFAPLVVANRWSGFINAVYAAPQNFNETQLRQLTLINGQAAVAIQNLRSLDLAKRRAQEALQRSDELSTLNRVVSQLTASFNLYELMDTVAQELITLFDLEHVGIALMDDNRQTLTVVTDTAREPGGESAVGVVLPIAGNLSTEKVLETLTPLIIEDAPNNPLTEPIHELLRWRGTETLIIMPLIASGEVIGTIGMDIAEKERAFTAAEMRLAETVVAQISASVQNVYLFEQTQRALAQTEILYRIGAELNAAQEYSEILTAIRRGGVMGKEAHYLSLALFERPWAGVEESQTLREAARWSEKPLPVSEATQFPLSEAPLPDNFWETGQPIFMEDVAAVADLPDELRQRYQNEYNAASLVAEPLLIGSQWIGYLVAFYADKQTFSATEQQQFNAVISQAAIALQNLRNTELAEQRAIQVEWLATIQSSLSQATNEDEIIAAISLFADLDQPPDVINLEYIHLDDNNQPNRMELMVRWQDGVIQADEPLLGQRRRMNESAVTPLWLESGAEILRIEDVMSDPRLGEETRRRAAPLQIGALALMPLRSGNRWQGVVTITWQQPHRFSIDEQFYLQQMLEPVSAIVAERRAYLAQQEALAETELLYQATAEFNLSLTYDDILATLRRHTIVGGEANSGLGLFNQTWTPDQPAEWVDAVATWSPDYSADTPRRFLVSDYPSVDKFLRADGPVFIENMDESDLDAKARALFKRVFRGNSAFFIPLLAGGQWIGYVSAFFQEPRTFAAADRRRLMSMTNQAAVAAQNARLIEQSQLRAEELLVLNEMGRDLTQLQEVGNVLDTVHHHISRLMEASDSFVALYDEELDEVRFRIYGEGENVAPAAMRRRTGQGITEHVIRSRQPLLVRENIRDVADKMGFTLTGRDSASWLGVPMFIGPKVVGVLTVQSFTKSRLYDEHHQDLLTAFASQTAIAIENIRLLQETQRRASELTVLNEMGRDLAETLDAATIVQSAYQYSSQLMDTSNFYIALYDQGKEWVQFALATEKGRQVNWGGRAMGHGLTEYIIRSRQSLVIPENVSDWLDNQGIANIGTPAQSWIGAPILFGDETLGVIALQSLETPHLFNEHHLELLNAVASQTASALANARLFQQVQMRARREELLRQITAEVRRSIDMETIMRTAVQEVGQALGRRAFIYLGDEPQPLTSEKEA